MDLKIEVIIGLVVGVILIGAMLPTALSGFYNVKSDVADHPYQGYDVNARPIANDLNVTNNAAVSAIFKLLPLFAVLGGMALIAGVGLKQFGYI
jgi:hypothetical protein